VPAAPLYITHIMLRRVGVPRQTKQRRVVIWHPALDLGGRRLFMAARQRRANASWRRGAHACGQYGTTLRRRQAALKRITWFSVGFDEPRSSRGATSDVLSTERRRSRTIAGWRSAWRSRGGAIWKRAGGRRVSVLNGDLSCRACEAAGCTAFAPLRASPCLISLLCAYFSRASPVSAVPLGTLTVCLGRGFVRIINGMLMASARSVVAHITGGFFW